MAQLAQVNIARLLAAEGDERVQGFFANIERINAIAEASDGFVWRYEGDYHGSDEQDSLLVFNLSVWQSIEHLAAFVYRSDHVDILRRKSEWMLPMQNAHSALWWVSEGERPAPEMAMAKLQLLNDLGPTAQAFTFAHRFDSPTSLK